MRKVILLGGTGSIGKQVLDVIREFNNEYQLLGFSFNSNLDIAKEIIKEFNPEYCNAGSKEQVELLQNEFNNINFSFGFDGLLNLSSLKNDDIMFINALVGSVGLLPTVKAIEARHDIYLANKETLVIGGEIITKLTKEYNVRIIPIDSEHSAIYQLLTSHNQKDVKNLLVTASGGPFRNLSKEDLVNVTKEDALKHPNWTMGNKITIDSATMMNKGFELIEAHYLFNIDIDHIIPILHEESLVHSMVEFNDGSIFMQASSPDMRLPIKYAMEENHSSSKLLKSLSFDDLVTMHFKKVDYERYPLVKVSIDSLKKGGLYPCILNAANEVAVNAFLQDKIKFVDIEQIIIDSLNNPEFIKDNSQNVSIELILKTDKMVKEKLFKELF